MAKQSQRRRSAADRRKKAKPASPKRRSHRTTAKAGKVVAKAGGLTVTEVAELKELRRQLEVAAGGPSPFRWNADPDDVQRSVARLVLTLVEFIRRLLERQAIRRMEARTLTKRQVEDVGRALMQLESTVRQIGGRFGLAPEDLDFDLGPLGRMM